MLRPEVSQLVTLLVTSAFAHEGRIVTKGSVVEVPKELAEDLLRRGKAELATADDAPPKVEAKPEQGPEPEAPKEEPFDLEKATRAALLIKALELGLEIADSDTKAQLKAKITEALAAKG